ncbi:MAG: class I SAM-dependent methyltransferase [Candidatus Bathyarchaeia archaeon]|jgi:tRNA (cmo5U34)-methyltransferase
MKFDNATPHLATNYDSQVSVTIPYYDAFHSETINLVKAMRTEPQMWLDTGCGTGTFVERALVAFPKTHFVLADPSEKRLLMAKKKLENAADDQVEFLKPAATQELGDLGKKFDVMTAIQSHHYLSSNERIKATKVCFELMAHGGVYITFENVRPMTTEGLVIAKEYWKRFQLAKGRDAVTVENHLCRFDTEYFPITIMDHLSLLKETGFSTSEILWYSYMQAGLYSIK